MSAISIGVKANDNRYYSNMKIDKKYYYSYSAERTLAFEKRLNDIGIKINPDSDLYRIGFNVLEVYEKHKKPELHNNNEDIREYMSRVMGFNNFIEKTFPFINSEYIDRIKPHMELLNKSSIPQAVKSKITDQGSNKLFELYVASLCYPDFNNIRLDSPDNSKGNNPDIMFDYNGQCWSIACKVLHSPKTKTIFDNVVKAVDQIEKSNCNSGFVFISLKNIIDYDSFWPILNKDKYLQGKEDPYFSSYCSVKIPISILESYVLNIQNDLKKEIGVDLLVNLFKDKKAQPVIVIFLQAPTGLINEGVPVFLLLGFLGMLRIDKVDDEAIKILNIINDKIH